MSISDGLPPSIFHQEKQGTPVLRATWLKRCSISARDGILLWGSFIAIFFHTSPWLGGWENMLIAKEKLWKGKTKILRDRAVLVVLTLKTSRFSFPATLSIFVFFLFNLKICVSSLFNTCLIEIFYFILVFT